MTIGTGSLVEISLVQKPLNQLVLNVFQYSVGVYPITVSPAQLAEGWWNNLKASYRGIVTTTFGIVFQSVRVRELNNPTGDYGEFAIPGAEQPGTRAPTAAPDPLPNFCAAGVRLVVGTRATRPGQKRFDYLTETDQNTGALQASFITPLTTLMNQLAYLQTLPAPALTVTLQPIVCRKDTSGAVTAHQNVLSYLIAANVTSQNTRKIGRGA